MEGREVLRRIREARGLSQEQLAHLVGLTRNALTDYERGKYNPRRVMVQKIDDALEANGELLAAYYPGSTPLDELRADHEALVRRVDQMAGQLELLLHLLAD